MSGERWTICTDCGVVAKPSHPCPTSRWVEVAPAADLLSLEEGLLSEEVLDEAEAAYKSSPVGGRRALETAIRAAIEEAGNGR